MFKSVDTYQNIPFVATRGHRLHLGQLNAANATDNTRLKGLQI